MNLIMQPHQILGLIAIFASLYVQAEIITEKPFPIDPFYKELMSIPDGSCMDPKYTDTPRSQEDVGVVLVKYNISAEGKTEQVIVVGDDNVGTMLKSLTYRQLSGCRFQPTILAGKPVASQIVIPVVWKLPGVSNPIVQVIDACRPKYPILARRLGAKGKTKLNIRVSETGEIINVSVFSSSSHSELDQAATNAIRLCKAVAGTSDGKPKEKNTIVTIDWELDD